MPPRLKREWLSVLATGLGFFTALYYFPRLPLHFASPWVHGSADAFNSRGWSSFFPVALMAALTLVFFSMPDQEPGTLGWSSAWRARPWVRGAIMLGLWWSQLLTLRNALSPEDTLESLPLFGTLGLLGCVAGIALGQETPAENVRHPSPAVRRGRLSLLVGGVLVTLASLTLPESYFFAGLLAYSATVGLAFRLARA
jgi:hypothetical protein